MTQPSRATRPWFGSLTPVTRKRAVSAAVYAFVLGACGLGRCARELELVAEREVPRRITPPIRHLKRELVTQGKRSNGRFPLFGVSIRP